MGALRSFPPELLPRSRYSADPASVCHPVPCHSHVLLVAPRPPGQEAVGGLRRVVCHRHSAEYPVALSKISAQSGMLRVKSKRRHLRTRSSAVLRENRVFS